MLAGRIWYPVVVVALAGAIAFHFGWRASRFSSQAPSAQMTSVKPAPYSHPPVTKPVYDYSAIDQYAQKAPESAARSVSSLAAYLVKPARNDREKARAIFRWITAHLAYDDDGMARGICEQNPSEVLRGRVTDCVGYSRMFRSLCQAAGVQAVLVDGCIRSLELAPYGRPAAGIPARYQPWYRHHVWNAARIEGQWRLIDCTWAGPYHKRQGKIAADRAFDPFFFLAPPEELIYSHLPYNPRWELLSHPVSTASHPRLPFLGPGFFRYDLKLGSHQEPVIRTGRQLFLTLGSPEDVEVAADLRQNSQALDGPFVSTERVGDEWKLSITFPHPGRYVLALFARRGEQSFNLALEYAVEVPATSFKGKVA